MDTTLRDGEQTSGVFSARKLIAQLLLEELNVDRIELPLHVKANFKE
jgi:isopropylmalate/homocitrate/citramalate synthase